MIELYHGDCLDIFPRLHEVDAIICDPPYGKTPMPSDQPIPMASLWRGLYRVRKRDSAVALFGSEPFSSMVRYSAIGDYKYDWYWIKNKKTNFLNANHQPLRRVENISIFYWNLPTYNPQKTSGHDPVNSYSRTETSYGETMGMGRTDMSGGGSTERYPDQCLYFPVINNDGSSPDGERLHPLQKPVALMEYLIKTYTNPGDTVLDFAAGSGSTGEACANLDRDCILIEKEEHYCNVIANRVHPTRVHW